MFGTGPKFGDAAVGERADSLDEGAKFGDMDGAVGCVASKIVGAKLGDSAAAIAGVVEKRAGKSGDEDSGSAGDALDTKAIGQIASAPSSTWS